MRVIWRSQRYEQKFARGRKTACSTAILKCRRRYEIAPPTIAGPWAIADALGHGEAARTALLKLYSNRPDEDPGVPLLADIGKCFWREESIASTRSWSRQCLIWRIAAWAEWRGVNDDRSPHKLTQSELARLLQPFGIRSKTIWPLRASWRP